MARASQIYLVYWKNSGSPPLAAFTVKYEAFKWCEVSGFGPDDVQVERMRDGVKEFRQKGSEIVPWPTNS